MAVRFVGCGIQGEVSAMPDRLDAASPDAGVNGISFVDLTYTSRSGYSTHHVSGIQIGACGVGPTSKLHFSSDRSLQEVVGNAFILRGPDQVGRASWEGEYQGRFISLDPTSIERMFRKPLSQFEVRPVSEHLAGREPIAHLLAALTGLQTEQGRSDPLIVESIALAIVRACRIVSDESDRRSPILNGRQIEVLRTLVASRLTEPLSLKEMAREVDLSESYLVRAFKGSFGVTPYRYVMRERVALAQSLIQAGGLSLGTVAELSGFPDAGQMGRTFRRITGRSPTGIAKPRKT